MTEAVCIIGAGSSGITAAQELAARGVGFDCFEMGFDVGGNWRSASRRHTIEVDPYTYEAELLRERTRARV